MAGVSFHEPETVEQAVERLGEREGARCLAGGATLVAMMNARLAEPGALVSLRRIEELHGIEAAGSGAVRLGAMTTHREVAAEARLRGGHAVVRAAAASIANPPVRNMGTIGGAISHADPAADYPPALAAAEAEIEIAGPHGRRRLPADAFFVDWYATALEAGELVTAVLLPPPPPGSVGVYDKLARVGGDMGIASVAVVLALDGDLCRRIRIAVGGCGPTPIRRPEAEAALEGGDLGEAAVRAAGTRLAEASDPVDDVRASGDYRRRVIPRLTVRAVAAARAQLGPPA